MNGIMGPDPDGNVGNFAREDFTLLNLSKSSSSPSSSDELFAHQQHQLPPSNPNKKKRLRLKRRSGYSVRQNRTSEDSSQIRSGVSPLGLGFGTSSSVTCALILLLLCWSATLSWLTFSLRNQLVTTNSNLASFEALTKNLPMDLAKMNQTIETLEGNAAALSTLVTSLQSQLHNYGKNMTDTNGLIKDIRQNLGLLGSKQSELLVKVEELQKKSPKEDIPPKNNASGGSG